MFIRRFDQRETQEVVHLWELCGLTRPWNDPLQDLDRAMRGNESDVLVGEQDGRVVGTVMVGHDGHRGWMYYVAVHPEMQRLGFGAKLVEAAESWLKDKGVPKSMLMIRDSNLPVTEFYTCQGYKPSGVVVMEKWLNK